MILTPWIWAWAAIFLCCLISLMNQSCTSMKSRETDVDESETSFDAANWANKFYWRDLSKVILSWRGPDIGAGPTLKFKCVRRSRCAVCGMDGKGQKSPGNDRIHSSESSMKSTSRWTLRCFQLCCRCRVEPSEPPLNPKRILTLTKTEEIFTKFGPKPTYNFICGDCEVPLT